MDMKVLSDDQHAFPPYQVCILARENSLSAIPGLREALAELSGKFSNQTMQQLNYQVDGRRRAVAEVAADFLKQAGLE
jgi:glycine betaine/choline ABC-type transport system substrate-binding protein